MYRYADVLEYHARWLCPVCAAGEPAKCRMGPDGPQWVHDAKDNLPLVQCDANAIRLLGPPATEETDEVRSVRRS